MVDAILKQLPPHEASPRTEVLAWVAIAFLWRLLGRQEAGVRVLESVSNRLRVAVDATDACTNWSKEDVQPGLAELGSLIRVCSTYAQSLAALKPAPPLEPHDVSMTTADGSFVSECVSALV